MTSSEVEAHLAKVRSATRRRDAETMIELMRRVTGEEPRMWATVVGFGEYHYKYASGREGDWMMTGFSPRKNDLTLYLMTGTQKHRELMEQLGKHKTSKGSCLYIKRLDDVHLPTLKKLIKESVKQLRDNQKSQSKS